MASSRCDAPGRWRRCPETTSHQMAPVQIKRWAADKPGWAITSLFMTASKFDSAPTGSSTIMRFLKPKSSPKSTAHGSASLPTAPSMQSGAVCSKPSLSAGPDMLSTGHAALASAPSASVGATGAGSESISVHASQAVRSGEFNAPQMDSSSRLGEQDAAPMTMAKALAPSREVTAASRAQISPAAANADPGSVAPTAQLHPDQVEGLSGGRGIAHLGSLKRGPQQMPDQSRLLGPSGDSSAAGNVVYPGTNAPSGTGAATASRYQPEPGPAQDDMPAAAAVESIGPPSAGQSDLPQGTGRGLSPEHAGSRGLEGRGGHTEGEASESTHAKNSNADSACEPGAQGGHARVSEQSKQEEPRPGEARFKDSSSFGQLSQQVISPCCDRCGPCRACAVQGPLRNRHMYASESHGG